MKKIFFLSVIAFACACSFNSCKKETPAVEPEVVKQFAYDGLSLYYFWADEMKSKKPTSADATPFTYFSRVLNATDKAHGWSWITDDVQALLAQFSGTPKDFGYELNLFWADEKGVDVVAIVKYVYPNTPASEAGIARGCFITKINGENLTKNNYKSLFGSSSIKITYNDNAGNSPKETNLVPRQITTNPVFYSNVYHIDGHKIAYLFYTSFIPNYNDKLYEVFSRFKEQGVTDLVLDLRYNHGGAITAAAYLSSLMAPADVVKNKSVFAVLDYNAFVNRSLDYYYNNPPAGQTKDDYDRKDYLGYYNVQKEKNPLDANLNLDKVHIIATGDSYSASELVTFCLKPYMKVVHVGDTTGGKYTASWTIHPFDREIGITVYPTPDGKDLSTDAKQSLQNWAMQPIVATYKNKDNKDFSSPGFLVPDFYIQSLENDVKKLKTIGDENDYLLAKAISLITGRPYAPQAPSMRVKMQKTNLYAPFDKVNKESVRLDNVRLTGEQMEEIRKFIINKR